MTSIFIWVRTGVVGVALCAAMPVLAQDLRDIPQKTDTTVSGPVTQPRPQTKQGGQMQGPPAPLETQLRDTPPDDLIVPQQQQRRPQIQPQPQIQSQTQTQPARPRQTMPSSQPTARPSAQQRVVPEQQVPSGRPSASGAIASDAVTENATPVQQDVSGVQANPMDNTAPLLPPQITPTSPATGMDDDLVIAPTGDTPIWLWLVGGLVLLGAGAFFMRRRVATAGDGIKFGETPWRDALDKGAPAPDTTVAKPVARSLPDVKIPTAPVKATAPSAPSPSPSPSPQPSTPPPMPEAIEEPTKATANESGLIVSRMRRPVEPSPSASVMAEPMQPAPPPPQPASSAEARVTNDGRIVSGRRASEFGGPAPTPKRKRPRKELPDGGMSFGYKVQR